MYVFLQTRSLSADDLPGVQTLKRGWFTGAPDPQTRMVYGGSRSSSADVLRGYRILQADPLSRVDGYLQDFKSLSVGASQERDPISIASNYSALTLRVWKGGGVPKPIVWIPNRSSVTSTRTFGR